MIFSQVPGLWLLRSLCSSWSLDLLLFVDVSGTWRGCYIHQRNTEFGDNKIWKILYSRLSSLWLPCVPQLMGIPFSASLVFQAFLSLCPLRLGTEAVAQPLQFSAVCHISFFRCYRGLNCPLPGNLFEYFVFEWRAMGAWG